MRISSLVSLAVCCLAFGCKSRTFQENTDVQTLEGMKVFSSTKINGFQLGFAKRMGIPHEVYKDVVDPSLPAERNFVMRIVFPSLTKAQYDQLMANYGGQNLVPYTAGRAYDLIDFLAPKMQALVNRWLVVTSESDPRIPREWQDPRDILGRGEYTPGAVTTGMNCWATAYEVLRDFGKPLAQLTGKIAYFGPAETEKLLWSDTQYQTGRWELPKANWDPAKSPERNAGRKVGDLLYIKTQYSYIGPAHVAIWIDDDLYFEKTNFQTEDPIRLAPFSAVVKPYLEQDSADRPMRTHFIRYNGAMPEPETLAGKYPYDGSDIEGLPPRPALPGELARNTVFTLDAGMGGGLSAFGMYRIAKFPVKQEGSTKRAVYEGATNISSFLIGNNVCNSKPGQGTTFKYTVDKAYKLYINNAQSGAEVAKIQGRLAKQVEGDQTVVMEFPATGKTLRILRDKYGLLQFQHPGVSDDISFECAQDPLHFKPL